MSVADHRYVRVRRTWIDITSSASRRDGILLYRPGRMALRVVPWLLGKFSFLPWHKLLGWRGYVSFGDVLPSFNLEAAVGSVESATIYTGNGTVKSKFTLLVTLRGTEHRRVIVKVGNTEGASAAIRHEYEALENLQASELKDQVPKPLGWGTQGSWTWASQTVLPRGKNSNTLKNEHLEFLDHLRQANVSHGDFTPWNCSIYNGKLLAWDWEDAGSFVDGKDVAWFKKQVKELLKKER